MMRTPRHQKVRFLFKMSLGEGRDAMKGMLYEGFGDEPIGERDEFTLSIRQGHKMRIMISLDNSLNMFTV